MACDLCKQQCVYHPDNNTICGQLGILLITHDDILGNSTV